MAAYTIVKSDGTTLGTVPISTNTTDITYSTAAAPFPNIADYTLTSVGLVKPTAIVYGNILDTNFVRITENFANTGSPLNPLTGQLWFDTGTSTLKVYNGSWGAIGGGTAGGLANGTSNVSIPAVNGNVNTSVGGTANVLVVTSTGANVAGTLEVTGTSNLNAVGNVTITGGTSGQYLQTNGSGVLSWQSISSTSIANGTSNVNIPAAAGNVNTSVGGTANVFVVTATGANVAGTLEVTGKTTIAAYNETIVALGTVAAASTLAITAGTVVTATLTASTPCTFTMPVSPTAGQSFILQVNQAATGMTTATFTGVKWVAGTAPTITATASAVDIISFIYIGTSWYGTIAQAYA
jgi:hypothetical protein